MSALLSFLKSKGYLFFFSASLVFVNFIITVVIAKKLDFGMNLDIYYISLSLYMFLLTSVGWSLGNVITPILIKHGIDESFNRVLTVILCWMCGIVIIYFCMSPILVDIVYMNYIDIKGADYLFSVFFLSGVIFIFDVISLVFLCLENASSRFARAIGVNLFSTVIGLSASFILVSKYETVGALLVQVIIKFTLLFILFFLNRRLLTFPNYDVALAREIFSKAKYFFISGLYYRTEDLTEKFIASFLSPGLLSLVSFIQRLYGAIITVINTVLVTPSLTRFCNNYREGNTYNDIPFILYISKLIICAAILLLPSVYFFGSEILLYVFKKQLIDQSNQLLITLLLLFPTLMLMTINQLIHNFLLSRSMEKAITIYDSVSYTLSLIVKISLTVKFAYLGLLFGIVFGAISKLFFKLFLFFKMVRHEKQISQN